MKRYIESTDRYPSAPITLFDFADPNDAVDACAGLAASIDQDGKKTKIIEDGWRLSDDRVIGGYSKASAYLMRSEDEYKRHLTASSGREKNDAGPASETAESIISQDNIICNNGGGDSLQAKNNGFMPFIRWKGMIDTTVGMQSDVSRSGFAALRSAQFAFDGANLSGMYDHLEIVCRPDDRRYTVNVKVVSSIPGDVYQGNIIGTTTRQRSVVGDENGSGGGFDTLVLPFRSFGCYSGGRQRQIQRNLDNDVKIESIGIALMDGKSGGFTFDLARVRAVNLYENSVFEGPPTAPI